MDLDERPDHVLRPVLEPSALPPFLFHSPPSTAVRSSCFVSGFEQARTEGAMDLDERPDDVPRPVLEPSALPPFLFHPPPSTAMRSSCVQRDAGRPTPWW